VHDHATLEQPGRAAAERDHAEQESDPAARIVDADQARLAAEGIERRVAVVGLTHGALTGLREHQPGLLQLAPRHSLEIETDLGGEAGDHLRGARRVLDQLDLDVELFEDFFGFSLVRPAQVVLDLRKQLLELRATLAPVDLEVIAEPAEARARPDSGCDGRRDRVLHPTGLPRSARCRRQHQSGLLILERFVFGAGGSGSATHPWQAGPSFVWTSSPVIGL